MKALIGDELDKYVYDHTTPHETLFERLREETYATLEMPQMQVGRVEGQFLKMMVQSLGAKRVLEIGTFSGYSGMCMASGLPEDGQLITCDVDPKATEVARRFFDESPWGSKITIKLGPAIETLALLKQDMERDGVGLDLVFIDADKKGYVEYYEAVLPMLSERGVILADNTLWSGKVLEPEEPTDHAIVRFNEHVQADERTENVLLSIRDGILMIRKK